MTPRLKSSLIRFLKTTLASTVAFMAVIPVNLDDPRSYLLALAAGAITGFLTGAEKYLRWTIEEPTQESGEGNHP